MKEEIDRTSDLFELVHGFVMAGMAGALTDAEVADFEQLLGDNAEARRIYLEYIEISVHLPRVLVALEAEVSPAEAPADLGPRVCAGPPSRAGRGGEGGPPVSTVLGFLGDVGRQGWGFLFHHALPFSVLAVLVLAGAVAFWSLNAGSRNSEGGSQVADRKSEISNTKSEISDRRSEISVPIPPSASSSIARLTSVADCRWDDQELEPGDGLKSGQSLHLAWGVAEVDFDIGVRVILQGPASLKLLSADSVQLRMGKLTAEITNKAARGFKIRTPEATLVDQGTEFGVEVTRGGSSRVHVFQGEVDVALDQNERKTIQLQRLTANCGARLEGKPASMTLLEDTGESFIRSMDQVQRDRHTVAYWRFEDRPLGVILPNTAENTRPVRATMDSSFNGNDLFAWNALETPKFSGDVPANVVPQTGAANQSCVDNTEDLHGIATRAVYSHSQFSHAAPLDLQKITPAAWTIEVSVRPKRLHCGPQTFVCRDSNLGEQPRLAFQITDRDQFAITFTDVEKRFYQAVASELTIEENRWYHLAAVSDGHTLKLYADCQDGRGYQLRASTELPKTGSTALGKSSDVLEWEIGRVGVEIKHWFQGLIDEVRISNVALEPTQFLFTPKDQGKEQGNAKR